MSRLFGTAQAQGKNIESIASYQMAEETMVAQKHEEVLRHICRTRELLRIANSKILYLEVQVLNELNKVTFEYLKHLQSAINAFEQVGDIDQFSQEKLMEVAIIKKELRLVNEGEKAEQSLEPYEKVMQHLFTLFPKPGISLKTIAEHPYATAINKYRIKRNDGTKMESGNIVYLVDESSEFTNNKANERTIHYISTDKNNKVTGYSAKVEIDHSDHKKAIAELIGVQNFDAVASVMRETEDSVFLGREGYFVLFNKSIETSTFKFKRERNRTRIKYIELSFYYQ